MFIRKTIGWLLIATGILGLLLLVWEFRIGVWLLALSGEDISYGGLAMLAIISIGCIISGIYLLNHNVRLPNIFRPPHYRSHQHRRNIPRTPLRKATSIILGIFSIWGIVISLQGISYYFGRRGISIPYEGFQWFKASTLPPVLRETALWVSQAGRDTWLIPSLILAGSIWLFMYSRILAIISNTLYKVRP